MFLVLVACYRDGVLHILEKVKCIRISFTCFSFNRTNKSWDSLCALTALTGTLRTVGHTTL